MAIISIDLLLVAGGGGGGSSLGSAGGGGGGAGGFRYFSNVSVSSTITYSVVIGAGGRGSFSSNLTPPTAGGNTTAFGSNANGGGYGGTNVTSLNAGGPGGSGGGGSGDAAGGGITVVTSPVQGYVGGAGGAATAGLQGAGGGGGANGNGVARTASVSGNGGPGNSWILGTYVFSGNYAGGGGGGSSNIAGIQRFGGTGGGGNGGLYGIPNSAQAGAPNTGGGGGGGAPNSPANTNYGGAGGSGIVLFRYPGIANATNLSNVTVAGGYVYHAITTSTTVNFYLDTGQGGIGGPYGGGGGGANGWVNSTAGGNGANGSALLTGNTGGYGGGGGGGSSTTTASGGGGGVDIWGLGQGGAGGTANNSGNGGSANLIFNTTSIGGRPGFNGNGGLFGGGGAGGAVSSVDTARGWGAGGAFVIIYNTAGGNSTYAYPNPSPPNVYTNLPGSMLNSGDLSLTQAITKTGYSPTGIDAAVNNLFNYSTPTALNSLVTYDTLATTPSISYNAINYAVPYNQAFNYRRNTADDSTQTTVVSRYFVANSSSVASVTMQPLIITTMVRPEFMLVNSDKQFVASNVNPTNYQTIQPVTDDNDPRLASIRTGYFVKGQTGTSPYDPQNTY